MIAAPRAEDSAPYPRMWSRGLQRLKQYGLRAHLLGALLRLRVPGQGLLLVMGGWSLPELDNRGGRLELGSCGLFSGVRLECWKDATISIGDGTYLNRNTEVVAARSVRVGRDCKIARDVIIMDTDQHALPGAELIVRPVEIGDRVWIGARAIVLKGVTVGHDAVIAAGAIVTRDVPAHGIVAGNPARPVR